MDDIDELKSKNHCLSETKESLEKEADTLFLKAIDKASMVNVTGFW